MLCGMRLRRRPDRRETELSLRPISNWMLLLAVVAVAVAGGGLTWWLLSIAAADPNASASVQIDAIRTGLSAAVGTGGAFALLLAFRRQRSTEISAVHTITDATERRVTELYTKAADQLGSDKAPVRLAGLYALERLAQDNPEQRQTIVNVICAYLLMPYAPSGPAPDEPSADDSDVAGRGHPVAQEHERYRQGVQEHEKRAQEHRVRTTAQRIVHRHLIADVAPEDDLLGWVVTIDLAGAYLAGANFSGAELPEAFLYGADLRSGSLWQANLSDAHLSGADFTGAVLGKANLTRADLRTANLTRADLDGADLTGASLDGANLTEAFLGGASWTDDTTWPPELRDEIRAASTVMKTSGVVAFRIREGASDVARFCGQFPE